MKEKIIKALKWFFRSYIWLFVLLLVIDIVTKQVVMHNMTEGQSIVLIPKDVLKITLVFNRAAAFGIGFDNPAVNRWLYVGIASLATICIVQYLIRKFKEIPLYVRACLMLVLTGAVGNLIDRLFYSASNYYVVDWINFFDNALWHWVFNIADAGVVIGAFMLIGYIIYTEVKEYKAKKSSEPKTEGKVVSKTEQEKIDYLNEEKEESEKVDN